MHLTDVILRQGHEAIEDTLGSVVIGWGDPNPEGTAQSVTLNYKGYRAERLNSVSQFVASASDSMWSIWKERVASPAEIKVLVVEDYSLDTCFAWLLFVARLEGRPASGANDFDEAAWVDYVTAWEEGKFVDVAMETSPACLHTVLGHSLLPDPGVDAKLGLTVCLRFLQEILDCCPSPLEGLPSGYSTELQQQAIAQSGYDRQQYRAALQRGTAFQLLLPSSVQRSGRLLLVDALALNETEPTGILKTMARTDLENAWTGRGFGVLALHRPSQAGSGNDMTVSVDPVTHLSLKALWQRLEAMEDERWAGDRPRHQPRPIVSYEAADGRVKLGSPHEPWWDDHGRYTLIGAPRESLSRLDWHEDVLPALWELYFLRHVRERVEFEQHHDYAGKNVHVAVWQPPSAATGGSDSEQQLPDAPSFHAWLAACSMTKHDRDVRSPVDLPNPDAFERVPHDGGYAVITRDGATLFHEAQAETGNNLLMVTEQLAEAVRSYSNFLDRYSSRLTELVQVIQDKHRAKLNQGRGFEAWLQELSVARGQLLHADAKLATLPAGLDADRLRAGLARMWGLYDRRDEVRMLIDRVDELVRESVTKRAEKRERIYGSLLSAGALALAVGQSWGPVGEILPLTAYQVELTTIVAYLGGFGIGLGLFWLLGIRGVSKL